MRKLAFALALAATVSVGKAQGFTVTPFGPSCGPVASGEVTPNGATYRFAFTVVGQPDMFVINVLAVTPNLIPIDFGYSCMLLSDIAFTQVHRTDHTGTYTWSHAMPNGFDGHAYVQFAEFEFDAMGQFLVRTSNALHMAPN